MANFYTWVAKDSADIVNYKLNKFTYTYKNISSEKAFWVFEESSEYKPAAAISKDRILLKLDFGEMAKTVILNAENHIDFESDEFKGETKHKNMIIVKSNEKGAYGIGANIRAFMPVKFSLASKKEVAKSLGKSEMEIPGHQAW